MKTSLINDKIKIKEIIFKKKERLNELKLRIKKSEQNNDVSINDDLNDKKLKNLISLITRLENKKCKNLSNTITTVYEECVFSIMNKILIEFFTYNLLYIINYIV